MSNDFDCGYEGLAERVAAGASSGALFGSLFDGVGAIPGGVAGAGAGAGRWLIHKSLYCNNDRTPNTSVNSLPSVELSDIDKR